MTRDNPLEPVEVDGAEDRRVVLEVEWHGATAEYVVEVEFLADDETIRYEEFRDHVAAMDVYDTDIEAIADQVYDDVTDALAVEDVLAVVRRKPPENRRNAAGVPLARKTVRRGRIV